jgi:hypothetical protein
VLLGLAVVLSVVTLTVDVFVWRGLGVRLEPTGLVDRGPLGILTVPWDALAPGYPLC